MEVLVGNDGGKSVVGMAEEGAVPTVQVGVEGGKGKRNENDNASDEESMVEKVGRIIEENLPPLEDEQDDDTHPGLVDDPPLEQGWIGQEHIFTGERGEKGEQEEEEIVPRNTKKRMWEEPVVHQPIRDEL